MQVSRLVEGLYFHQGVDVLVPHPRHETMAVVLLALEEQGCQDCDANSCRSLSSQVLKEVMAGNNVKGVDYRTVGRMVLSGLHVDKAHILRKGGRWILCHLQSGGIVDVLPQPKKNIGWQGVRKAVVAWAVMVMESVGTSGLIATELKNPRRHPQIQSHPSAQLSKCLLVPL